MSDGDQLALSYLEAVAVSKASAGKALVSSATALVSPAQRAPESEGDGEEGVQDRKNGKNSREECAEELDDDDDVGFRISFVSWEKIKKKKCNFSLLENGIFRFSFFRCFFFLRGGGGYAVVSQCFELLLLKVEVANFTQFFEMTATRLCGT